MTSLDLDSPEAVRSALAALEARREELGATVNAAFGEAGDLGARLGGIVLARWPVLDDPYHPDYPALFAHDRGEIAAFLDESDDVARWARAEDDAEALLAERHALEVEIALHRRITQALETVELGGRLRARGGESWARYERMRACEATPP